MIREVGILQIIDTEENEAVLPAQPHKCHCEHLPVVRDIEVRDADAEGEGVEHILPRESGVVAYEVCHALVRHQSVEHVAGVVIDDVRGALESEMSTAFHLRSRRRGV